MSEPLRVHRFVDTTFNREAYLVVGTRKDFLAHLEAKHGKKFNRTVPRDCLALCFQLDGKHPDNPDVVGRVFYVWLTRWEDEAKWISMLCHECAHLTFQVLSFVGIDISADSEECFTYYQDALVEQGISFLRSST